MLPNFRLEKQLWRQGYSIIAGVDEVGRGAWAGPIVAAAVVVPKLRQPWFNLVRDSKIISAKIRQHIFDLLPNKLPWALGIVNNVEIDEIGIAEANRRAIKLAIVHLKTTPSYVLSDYVYGLTEVTRGCRTKVIIDGDAKVFSIALASIIAKVKRDQLMIEMDKQYPCYGFAQHKGYGTRQHEAALKKHGPCLIHRRTYRPIKQWPAILERYES
jgi:ribonuclease HII